MGRQILPVLILLAAILAGCARSQAPSQQPSAQQGYMDAVDLQERFRSMADQLLSDLPDERLKGYVAMPTSFVNENNTTESSPLGRLIAESMYHEFNQRGFPVREYRLTGNIAVSGGKDDLALVSNQIIRTKGQKWAALLVGTYMVEKDATFVHARLVRASDGLVLRTAELTLPNTPIVLSLTRGGSTGRPYVAPQSAPVRAPSYPSLGGSVIQSGTASIPLIQGR